ncbi:Uma2 family endonuclease [Thermobifida alba]|uniref:Uma2 family endonuclease n=1 Tax=Thermobifida alba TaxID=53522 RepID=UPI0020BDBDAF|nr:Uma2 family endonuclease [Thermobifida alba]
MIQRPIDRRIPDGWEIRQGTGVAIVSPARRRAPDLLVVPSEAVPEEREVPIPSEEVLLAVEVVSRDSATDDRVTRREECAGGRIPLYLLVDGYDPRGAGVTLFATPKGGDHADSHRVDWGEPVALPEPFGFDLETAGFRVPRD